jgi:hypothetical protein
VAGESTKKKGGRPKNAQPSVKIELRVEPRLSEYLDDLLELQGFGKTRQDIISNFAWDRVNRLIETGRLTQRNDKRK